MRRFVIAAVAALVATFSLAVILLVGVVLGYNVYLQHRVDSAIAGEQRAQSERTLAEQRAELAEKGQRLAALRAECGPILEQAEAALERKELEAAESLAFKAQVKSGEDPALADLKERADRVAKQARHLLIARGNLRQLFQGRDDALGQAQEADAELVLFKFDLLAGGQQLRRFHLRHQAADRGSISGPEIVVHV